MSKNGWQVKSLNEVAFITAGQSAPQGDENFSKNGYPFIRAGSLDSLVNGCGYDKLEKIEESIAKYNGLKLFAKGCVLFAKSGMSSMKDRVVVLESPSYVVSHLAVVQPYENMIPEYLAFWLGHFRPSRIIKDESYPSISLDAVSNIKIPIPPLPIQKQIAKILEKADQAKQKRQEANKLTEQFLQSAFIEMFGDPVSNPKNYPIIALEKVCLKITDGTHNSPNNDKKGKYKYITAKNIKRDGIDLENITFISEEDHKKIFKRCNPEYGDILYIKDGATTGIAQINTLKEEFSMLSSLALLKLDKNVINPFYLRDYLNNDYVYHNIRCSMGGAAITRLTIDKLKKIRVLVPPLRFQNQFEKLILKTETLKEKQKQSEIELENLFNSLMQKAFNGELVS